MLGHVGIPGLAPFIAMGLFLAAIGAGFASYTLLQDRPSGLRRGAGTGLAAIAVGCLLGATAFPLLIHASVGLTRPATSARLAILSPRQGEVVRGDPASIDVRLSLQGGKIVPFSSLHLAPNEGHIHLYLDGKLVSMATGLEAAVTAAAGRHTLTAEFVAVDHGPFRPRVLTSVTFQVRP